MSSWKPRWPDRPGRRRTCRPLVNDDEGDHERHGDDPDSPPRRLDHRLPVRQGLRRVAPDAGDGQLVHHLRRAVPAPVRGREARRHCQPARARALRARPDTRLVRAVHLLGHRRRGTCRCSTRSASPRRSCWAPRKADGSRHAWPCSPPAPSRASSRSAPRWTSRASAVAIWGAGTGSSSARPPSTHSPRVSATTGSSRSSSSTPSSRKASARTCRPRSARSGTRRTRRTTPATPDVQRLRSAHQPA